MIKKFAAEISYKAPKGPGLAREDSMLTWCPERGGYHRRFRRDPGGDPVVACLPLDHGGRSVA